jgi:uncharacterized surface protein with fasciclin (FAS1) repeats
MESVLNISKFVITGIRRDSRLRYGAAAGASVLLSAGMLGMGGSLAPSFLHAAESPRGVLPASHIQMQAAGLQVIDMSTSTVAEVIQALPKAERFELMLYNSGLDEVLRQAGTITVFVPASAQFDYLPKRYIANLSRAQLRELALGHIVERALPIEESLNGSVVTAGQTVLEFAVDAGMGEVTIGGAKAIKAYQAKNGWVYIIDRVLVDAED